MLVFGMVNVLEESLVVVVVVDRDLNFVLLDPFKLTPRLMLGGLDIIFCCCKKVFFGTP